MCARVFLCVYVIECVLAHMCVGVRASVCVCVCFASVVVGARVLVYVLYTVLL